MAAPENDVWVNEIGKQARNHNMQTYSATIEHQSVAQRPLFVWQHFARGNENEPIGVAVLKATSEQASIDGDSSLEWNDKLLKILLSLSVWIIHEYIKH